MSQSETIRLLIINDDPSEVERLLSMLRNSGRNTRPQHVPSLEILEKLLSDQAWDLLLAVDTAKSCDPKSALRTIKKMDKDIPAIFLTESDPDEFNVALIDGMKAGARDVVILDDDQHLLMTMTRELDNLEERRENRASHRKLKEAERRCQQLLDSSRDAIAYVEDGMFLYANRSFAEQFGYKDIDDIITIPVIDVVADADQEKYKSFMKSFKLSNDGEQKLSLSGIKSDSSKFGIEIAVTHALYENEPCVQLLVAAKEGMNSAAVEAEIKRASSMDALTGVYNRVYMTNALGQAIRDAAEKDKYSSLHIISIDQYEEIRASVGVSGRDAAIADIAKFLKEAVGSNGTFGRLSDEEFGLIASGVDQEQQTKYAQDLCAKISSHICQAAGKSVQLTASIGISPITEKVTNPDQVLERSHTACEEARQAGKNGKGDQARFYVPKLSTAGASDDSLIMEVLETALSQDRFKLRFQPIISLQGDPTERYEVLLSMLPDANGKTIGSDEMFKIINRNGEIGKRIDRWTLLNAAKTLAAHRSTGHDTHILVNITASSLQDSSLPAWLSVAFKTANLPPEAIILQFNEADASSYLTQAIALCTAMKKMNIRCGIKQFGCSLDPFKTLAHLDVDTVKIDASFSIDIQQKNEKPDTLKNLITKLGEAGKQTIVPFVENATLLATLWQSGASFIQGNYIQPPGDKMDFVFSDE